MTAEITLALGELLEHNPGEPRDWPDPARLRLLAIWFEARDRGVVDFSFFDQVGDEVQTDIQRIADHLENISDSDPRWVHLPPGSFALHIHPGGNAVIVDAGPGAGDIAAFRDWLQSVWPQEEDQP